MKRLLLPLLAALALPTAVNGTMSANHTAEVKSDLIMAIKECAVLRSMNETATFSDTQTFRKKNHIFEIQPIIKDSCYSLIAKPKNEDRTWFEIDYDPETRKLSKTCGDSSKPGCEEGNTW